MWTSNDVGLPTDRRERYKRLFSRDAIAKRKQDEWLIMKRGKQPLGFVAIERAKHNTEHEVPFLHSWYIAKEARTLGSVSRFAKFVKHYLEERGITSVRVITKKRSPEARMYQSIPHKEITHLELPHPDLECLQFEVSDLDIRSR
jgi:hypothetical protein